MPTEVAVVAHTHWDREWYVSFESYRSRLIPIMDDLLELLDRCPEFRHFHLDGQVAMVDDYLAVRPEAEPRLSKLVQSGRLAVGPWYVLMDEFCVSGETIIRNLQLGLRRAAALGGASSVGYLPDMFGHVDQMPQILQGAGIEHAVVWRGVPSAMTGTSFWWSAPDGSRVRTEYLPVGYANGAFLPSDSGDFLRRIRAHDAETVSRRGISSPILLLNGGDHHPAQAELQKLLAEANAAQDDYRFSQTSLVAYLSGDIGEPSQTWSGELRSGSAANLLMGVLSNRRDVKLAAATMERLLEKMAEPLAALWLPSELWPARVLDEAWLAMIRNSAHDSICACSSDAVTRAVLHRYDTVGAIGLAVVEEALAIAGVATAAAGPVVVNPSARARSGVVELVLPGEWLNPRPGLQLLEAVPSATTEITGTGADLGRILGELAAGGWLGSTGRGTAATVESDRSALRVNLTQDDSTTADPGMAAVMAEAWAAAGADRSGPLTVKVQRLAAHRVAALVDEVPGFGWSAWTPSAADVAPAFVDGVRIGNGLVEVEIEPSGTFSLDGVGGYGAVVDGGDDGDTYNYCPPVSDQLVEGPESVSVDFPETGPVRARAVVRRIYRWPEQISDGRRVGLRRVEVSTEIEVRAGESMVRVTTSFDNVCRDHRVRVLLPLPNRSDSTVAETAFATVRRADSAEGGPHEWPLATFPSRRFVSAGGLLVTHEGLLEYELVEGGHALALTLVRCTGILSKPAPMSRPNAAGPALAVPGAQMPGPHVFRYALSRGGDPWQVAEDAWTPLPVVRGTGTGHLPPKGCRLTLRGAELSALYRRDGWIEVRVFNPHARITRVELPDHTGCLVDLKGEEIPGSRWTDSFELGAHRLATARLASSSLD